MCCAARCSDGGSVIPPVSDRPGCGRLAHLGGWVRGSLCTSPPPWSSLDLLPRFRRGSGCLCIPDRGMQLAGRFLTRVSPLDLQARELLGAVATW